MAKLSHPTDLEIQAPLLIEQSHLTALDTVLDQYTARIKEEQEQQLEDRIERRIREHSEAGRVDPELRRAVEANARRDLERERRGVALYLSGGRTLAAKKFEEAVNQPHLMGEVPLGFRCDSEIGHVETSIVLRSTWTTTLQITVKPTSSLAAQELYGALENWASEIRPPDWQRFWLKATSLFRFVLFFWVILGLPFMYFGIEREAKYVYQPEAKQLLDQGINPSNQQKALELILTIVSGAGPKNPVLRPGIRGWGYWVVVTLVLGALSCCPKAVIGV